MVITPNNWKKLDLLLTAVLVKINTRTKVGVFMNRNKIKWLPFNSIINTQETLKERQIISSKHSMPILSEEQINELEENIIFNYYAKKEVIIKYFQNGYIFTIKSVIKKIDDINHLIILSNNTTLFFNQIITLQ